MAIDPRIRQRRIEVRREEGRRRLRLLVAGASSAALLGGAWGVTHSPLLDVDRVAVAGARHTPEEAVARASGLRPGHRMTGVDEAAAAVRVARLPWVATADVSRRWPGTVTITVRERTPAAVARAVDGGWMLVDAKGRLLQRAGTPPEDLVAIEGVAVRGRPGQRLDRSGRAALAVARAIPRDRVTRLRVVARLPDGSLEVRLAPSGVVRLGPPDEIGDKVVAALTVLDQADVADLAVLDVRIPGAPVLTRRAPVP